MDALSDKLIWVGYSTHRAVDRGGACGCARLPLDEIDPHLDEVVPARDSLIVSIGACRYQWRTAGATQPLARTRQQVRWRCGVVMEARGWAPRTGT